MEKDPTLLELHSACLSGISVSIVLQCLYTTPLPEVLIDELSIIHIMSIGSHVIRVWTRRDEGHCLSMAYKPVDGTDLIRLIVFVHSVSFRGELVAEYENIFMERLSLHSALQTLEEILEACACSIKCKDATQHDLLADIQRFSREPTGRPP